MARAVVHGDSRACVAACTLVFAAARLPCATTATEKLIASYFNIVRKNVLDLVPKTVMCFLVNCTKGTYDTSHAQGRPPSHAPTLPRSRRWLLLPCLLCAQRTCATS